MIPPPANGGAARHRIAYVYLLRSGQDGSYYVGWTTDVLRRLGEHNRGLGTYSRRKLPWQLIGVEVYSSPMAAKARERVLKRSPRSLARFKKRVLTRAALVPPPHASPKAIARSTGRAVPLRGTALGGGIGRPSQGVG